MSLLLQISAVLLPLVLLLSPVQAADYSVRVTRTYDAPLLNYATREGAAWEILFHVSSHFLLIHPRRTDGLSAAAAALVSL